MATSSALFPRLVNVWNLLSLRCDVDDIILELLGRFSLERIYAGPGDKEAYQSLVIALLAKLNAVFYIQRLTLPADNVHIGWYLGYLVSWEVALRSIEFILQMIGEARESLWEHRALRDKYLADFLHSALRFLALHPKAPANQRAKDRRDRFARIHRSIEQVFDSYPGPKSFLLEVCKEVTALDSDALGLPPSLKSELPNLTSELVGSRLKLHPILMIPFADKQSRSTHLRDVLHPTTSQGSPRLQMTTHLPAGWCIFSPFATSPTSSSLPLFSLLRTERAVTCVSPQPRHDLEMQ